MHEYSITNAMVEIIKKNIKGKDVGRVIRIHVKISSLSQIEPESVRFYYQILTEKEKQLKGAKLVFDTKPVQVQCSKCGKVSQIEQFLMHCPQCQSKDVSIDDDQEIQLLSLETEDERMH